MVRCVTPRESPGIIRFFPGHWTITELLKSEPDRYMPVLNGDRYITEAELSELLKITRRTLVEHRTTGLIPYYRLGGRILYKEKDIIKLLDENRLEAF
ncbi:helix-turn-helix domain-containing protein [Bacteroides sp. BFG-551]|nr:helix-turn-helix domain-containing protein [Bacteroides sp. BFG-551]